MRKKLAALALGVTMTASLLAGCSGSQTTAPTAAETETAAVQETVGETVEETQAEAADGEAVWKPYDENGEVLRTGRDANGTSGVVSTGKYEATKIGVEIIEAGGNAVDAAVAVGFALGVCEPQSSGIGGGGFMTLRLANGETTFIDFREVAPAAAEPSMWQKDAEGNIINNEKKIGGKAIGVPGEVKGLLYVLEEYGTMTREQVMNPSINMAKEGYEVSAILNRDIMDSYDTIEKYPATAAIYLNEGLPYQIGETVKNPDLAKTLELIRDNGESAFYTGPVAEAMIKAVQDAGGCMTQEDLDKYEIAVREPVRGTYRGYEIISSPPPSSGGTHIIEMLNIMENFDVASMEVNSAEYLHMMSEVYKMAFADRAKYMGDPAFLDLPITGLTSKEYAKALYETIDMEQSQEYKEGDPWPYESDQTTHYSIMDKEGNMVAVTKTVNNVFASGVVAEGTGILMNNQMNDFDFGEGLANSVAGNKKPLSSMSPTLVLKDGKPVMSIGCPGGVRIFGGVVQVISKYIDHGMDIQEAIDSPRIHDSFGELMAEGRISDEVVKELEAMGHKITVEDEWVSYPCVQATVMLEDGTLRGGADPRRDGKALGY